MNWEDFTNPKLPLPGMPIPGANGYRRVSADEYHAFPAVNASLMKCRTAAEMFAQLTAEKKDTDALTIGTLVHMVALEPESSWQEKFAVADIPINPKTEKPYGKDTKKGAEAWSEAASAHPGRIIVTPETFREYMEVCKDLQRALQANPDAMGELENIHTEATGFIFHPRWQCWVKWRPDILPRHGRYLADLKTTSRHVADFAKDAWQFGYFSQAAWYVDLHELLMSKFNLHVSKFTFIVLSKTDDSKYPRPAMCRVYDVPMDGTICRGIDQARKSLGIPEGFSRVDTFLDCLRNYIDAGCPHPTPHNFGLIRRIWPAYELEAGEKGGRWVLAD